MESAISAQNAHNFLVLAQQVYSRTKNRFVVRFDTVVEIIMFYLYHY